MSEVTQNAKRMQTLVLQRLSEPGRAVAIATALGLSEATISRMKNEHLETFCALLAHAGLKIVPAEARVYPQEKIDALLVFAKAHLEQVSTADDLMLGGRE